MSGTAIKLTHLCSPRTGVLLSFKIYFDNVLHLYVGSAPIGIQSWVCSDKSPEFSKEGLKYVIEILLPEVAIVCEYDEKEKWETILNLLNGIL